MSQFEPYYTWLGIPPKDQPPDYYRLLGVERFEENIHAIENAADRQMFLVRTFQNGPHAAESQQLLNELAAAKVCLTVRAKKADYDARLRGPIPFAQPAMPPMAQFVSVSPSTNRRDDLRRKLVSLAVGVGLGLIAVFAVLWMLDKDEPSDELAGGAAAVPASEGTEHESQPDPGSTEPSSANEGGEATSPGQTNDPNPANQNNANPSEPPPVDAAASQDDPASPTNTTANQEPTGDDPPAQTKEPEDEPEPQDDALEEKLKELGKQLELGNEAERLAAIEELGDLGARAEQMRAKLCELLIQSNERISTAAADALRKIDPAIQELALKLVLNYSLDLVKEITEHGENAGPVAPILLSYSADRLRKTKLLQTDNSLMDETRWLIHAAAHIAPNDDAVNREVLKTLKHAQLEIRHNAQMLCRMVKDGKKGVPDILAYIRTAKPTSFTNATLLSTARCDAVQTLMLLLDDENVETIQSGLRRLRFDQDEVVRKAIAEALDEIEQRSP